MLETYSITRRRLLALGILLIVILVVAVVVVEPYFVAYKDSVEHLDAVTFRVKQDKKAIQKQEFYVEEIERLSRIRGKRDTYLRSDRIALATAEIQKILKSTAQKSGAELISSRPLVEDPEDSGKVGVQVRAKANIFGLRKLLHGLEGGRPRLFIDEITVSRGGRAVYRFGTSETTNETLDIQIYVFGYIKKS